MFSLNSFKPVSFSLQSFKMAEEANSGRSGYWKLFFYNMQEEALRKHEQKQGKGTPQGAPAERHLKNAVPKLSQPVDDPLPAARVDEDTGGLVPTDFMGQPVS